MPGSSPLVHPKIYELRCADVHPVHCDTLLCAPTVKELLTLAREHGGREHGFTPAWYSPQRVATLVRAVRPLSF